MYKVEVDLYAFIERFIEPARAPEPPPPCRLLFLPIIRPQGNPSQRRPKRSREPNRIAPRAHTTSNQASERGSEIASSKSQKRRAPKRSTIYFAAPNARRAPKVFVFT